MLWLSLVFPDLALECLPGLKEAPEPWGLESQGALVAVNATATRLGAQVGLGVAAALALVPDLRHRPYDAEAESTALCALADWALGFSADVVIEAPQSLLLEIGSSLRYFGGLQALLGPLQQALQARNHTHQWAVAPTPLAALWCARVRSAQILMPDASLVQALGPLSLKALHLPERQLRALQGVGLDCVADCVALPSRTLALRYGLELVNLLDRALGRIPDPRQGFQPPETFSRRVELPLPVAELPRCLPVLTGLLPDLIDWARRHGQLLTRLEVRILHERQPFTQVVVGFAGTRRIEHVQLVLEEQLQRVQLGFAVAGFQLQVLGSVLSEEPSPGLLPAAPVRMREGQELGERLRARLGHQAVQGLAEHADHRPEHAWRFVEPGSRHPSFRLQQARPLWLLEAPRDLGDDRLPVLRRPLHLLCGPERIESGWWDGSDQARDYFIAAEPQGPHYWVFRDCRGTRRWFLHGVFA